MSKKTWKTKAVDEAKRIAKERENYRCQKCPKTKEQGWQMHGSHIMPVEYGGTAADPDNILCLCASCHSMGRKSMHEDPIEFSRWYEEKFPGKYDILRKQALDYTKNPFPKINWEDLCQILKEETGWK